jgi:bifunctional non-homologous end joining protein LigD
MECYLTVPDSGTLAALVDHGCLSFHPWNSTAVAAPQPTQMVFNLDPEAIAFREVRNAALLLRDLLDVCGLAAWVKTSGGQGLHVLVPLRGRASFDDARLVADTIVKQAMRREPRLFSRDPRRGKRRGRILIDTSRNESGATIIAPYAVAASGFVSAFLDWDELRQPIYPENFGLDAVVARERADLNSQATFFAAEQSLEPLVQRTRSRRLLVDGRSRIRQDAEWRLGETSAAVGNEAHRLIMQSRRPYGGGWHGRPWCHSV